MSITTPSTQKSPGVSQETEERAFLLPRVDIVETEDTVLLEAEMPGVDESGIDVTVERNVLTIRGSVQPPQMEGYTLAYSEYEIGNYEREFTLSQDIDREHIEATVKDGVLRLTLPKSNAAGTHKISVKAG